MNKTMTQSFREGPDLTDSSKMDPIHLSPAGGQAYKLKMDARNRAHNGQAGGIFNSKGFNPHVTSNELHYGEAYHQRSSTVTNKNASNLKELTKTFATITPDNYIEFLKAKPYLPKEHLRKVMDKNATHGSNILSSTFLNEKIKGAADLAELER